MKLELISFALCPFVHRACIMLREKGVEFTRRDIELEHKPEWFLALSPRGKVPVLVADGVPLFESAAICEFLDETHPPRMIPDDPFERARQRAWVEVASELFGAQHKLFMSTSAAELEANMAPVTAILGRYEEALTSGRFAEDGFGLIEVATAPALFRFAVLGAHIGRRFWAAGSKVEAWGERAAARPSVRSTVRDEFAALYMDWLRARGSYLARATTTA